MQGGLDAFVSRKIIDILFEIKYATIVGFLGELEQKKVRLKLKRYNGEKSIGYFFDFYLYMFLYDHFDKMEIIKSSINNGFKDYKIIKSKDGEVRVLT